MFGWLFKKKSERDLLEIEYKKLMVRSYEMSKINRSESDRMAMEADQISKQIDELDRKAAAENN